MQTAVYNVQEIVEASWAAERSDADSMARALTVGLRLSLSGVFRQAEFLRFASVAETLHAATPALTPLAKPTEETHDKDDSVGLCWADDGGEGTVVVTHWARRQFGALHASFGLSADVLMQSLCGRLESSQQGGGNSAAVYYRSCDQRFMLKSLTKQEAASLLEFLPAYKAHVTAQPSSRLPRLVGMLSVSLESHKLLACYVIMENFFALSGPMDAVYDLKGSKYKRCALSEEERTLFKEIRHNSTIMKDVDYILNEERLFLLPAQREALIKTLQHDSDLLLRCGFMDYSLLLGLQRAPASQLTEFKAKVRCWMEDPERFGRFAAHPAGAKAILHYAQAGQRRELTNACQLHAAADGLSTHLAASFNPAFPKSSVYGSKLMVQRLVETFLSPSAKQFVPGMSAGPVRRLRDWLEVLAADRDKDKHAHSKHSDDDYWDSSENSDRVEQVGGGRWQAHPAVASRPVLETSLSVLDTSLSSMEEVLLDSESIEQAAEEDEEFEQEDEERLDNEEMDYAHLPHPARPSPLCSDGAPGRTSSERAMTELCSALRAVLAESAQLMYALLMEDANEAALFFKSLPLHIAQLELMRAHACRKGRARTQLPASQPSEQQADDSDRTSTPEQRDTEAEPLAEEKKVEVDVEGKTEAASCGGAKESAGGSAQDVLEGFPILACAQQDGPDTLRALSGDLCVVGIVDILQQYTVKKYVETSLKGVLVDNKMVSSQPPEPYAQRWQHLCKHVFLSTVDATAPPEASFEHDELLEGGEGGEQEGHGGQDRSGEARTDKAEQQAPINNSEAEESWSEWAWVVSSSVAAPAVGIVRITGSVLTAAGSVAGNVVGRLASTGRSATVQQPGRAGAAGTTSDANTQTASHMFSSEGPGVVFDETLGVAGGLWV
eukprot:g31931.t1